MFNQSQYTTLIEIITPVYNSGKYLFETYDSLLKQTINDFLWILVNDGSEDEETNSILERLSQNDSRIHVIRHLSNKGLPASRNTGIRHSRAPYIFFLDSDDLIHPNFLEKAYLFLETHLEYKFVNSWVVGFGAQQYYWTGGFHDKGLFLTENRNTSCFMARRGVFDKIQFDESIRNGCEDWDFWLNAASNNFWGYSIPEYLFFYRRTEKSKWDNLNSSKRMKEIRGSLQAQYGPNLLKKGFPAPQQVKYEFGKIGTKRIFLPLIKSEGSNEGRILCLFPWVEMGGADLFNLRFIEQLSKRDWKVTILTTLESKQELSPAFENITNDVFHLANLGKSFLYSIWIRYFIETRKPDIIFLSNSMYGYYLLPWLKMNFPTIRIVDYVHCEDPGWYNGGYPFFSATYTNCLDKTFVSSNQLGDWCIERGADRNKVETCYINVDTKVIRRDSAKRMQIRNRLGLADSTQLILYVARLTAQKRPQMVVEILSRIRNKKYKCIIIGDGPEKSSLLLAIKKHNLNEQIFFLGAQSNEVVMNYMDAADIFFLPSQYEGIALSIYEAMAKSLAIVGADTGGQKELVTEECGVLIKETEKQSEIEKYVAVFNDLLKAPDQATIMGMASRLRVEQLFDNSKMVLQMHTSLSALKMNHKTQSSNIANEYLVLLERFLYIENINEELYEKSNNRVNKIIQRNKKAYKRVRTTYHKIKKFINSFTTK